MQRYYQQTNLLKGRHNPHGKRPLSIGYLILPKQLGDFMEIARAVTADIPELCTLLDSLFTQEREFEPNHEKQVRGLGAVIDGHEVGCILVARKAGKIIGMVNLLYTISTALGERVGILEDLVVSSKARGSGVGSDLLNCAFEVAKKKGCKRITLLTDNDNEEAHRFYQQHGFRRSSMAVFRRSLNNE